MGQLLELRLVAEASCSQNDVPNGHCGHTRISLLGLSPISPPYCFIKRLLRQILNVVLEEEHFQLLLQFLPLSRFAVFVKKLAQDCRPARWTDLPVLKHGADHHVGPKETLSVWRFVTWCLVECDFGKSL